VKNIQTLLKNNFLEAFRFKRYSIFSWWFRIIVIFFMLPIIINTIFLGVWYQIIIFFFKLTQGIPKYIKETIDENKVSAAPLFVVYFIAYPIKFYFDLIIAFNIFFLSFLHLIFVSFAYVTSFGGIKFQPYLMEADGNVEKTAPTYRVPSIVEIVLTAVLSLIILLRIFIPMISLSIEANNERIDIVAERVSSYLVDKNFQDDYSIIEAYYFSDESKPDFAIVRIQHNGVDYFIQVYESNFTQTRQLTLTAYSNLKTSSSHDKRHSINANKLERVIAEVFS